MNQQPENKQLSLEDILEILRSEAQVMPHSPTSLRYLRALDSWGAVILTAGPNAPTAPSASSSSIVDSAENADNVENLLRATHPYTAATAADTEPSAPILRAQRADTAATAADTEPSAPILRAPHADTAANAADTEPSAPILRAPLADTPYSILYTSLTDWLVNLWLTAVPYTTASLYLDIVSSLYGSAVKAGKLPKTKVFSEVKAQLKALGATGWKSGIDDEIFARALRLTKNAGHLISDDAIAADLVILSLTHSLAPLTELALLKKEDIDNIDCVADTARSADTDPKDPILRSRYSSQVLSLILNNLSLGSSRRKYLFPLQQSSRTAPQLKKYVAKICNALFKRARLPQATDPMQTVEALWAYAALRAGIPASTLVAYLGRAPLGLPILKLSFMGGGHSDRQAEGLSARVNPDRAAGLSLGEFHAQSDNPASEDSRLKTEDFAANRGPAADTPYCEADTAANAANTEPEAPILRAPRANTSEENFSAVGKIFLENPPRWYAMSLRPGVRFTQVCRRIQLHSRTQDSRLKTEDLRLFYPCEEIARAIGKKIVIKERPFIHSVVFFKARLTDIGRLFAKIGDLAWCYRQSARLGAPYADISERQFQLFQQTIARFTPDFEVAPTGELELRKNDRVEILGGLFAGHEATFDSIVMGGGHPDRQVPSEDSRLKTEDSNTVYRLNIIGENGIEWRISVDSRLATPK